MGSGVSTYLKSKKPDCHTVLVEPTESRAMVGAETALHGLTGISGMKCDLIEKLAPGQPWVEGRRGPIDEFNHCNTPDGIQMVNNLAKMEGCWWDQLVAQLS